MGGVDKGMQPFRGEPLALHVMRRIAPQAGALLISANRSIEDYERLGAAFGARVIPDARAEYPGPLAGIAAALRGATTEYVLTAPCDAPFVDEHIGVALMQALETHGGDIAYAATVDGSGQVMAHPVFALLRTSLADEKPRCCLTTVIVTSVVAIPPIAVATSSSATVKPCLTRMELRRGSDQSRVH